MYGAVALSASNPAQAKDWNEKESDREIIAQGAYVSSCNVLRFTPCGAPLVAPVNIDVRVHGEGSPEPIQRSS